MKKINWIKEFSPSEFPEGVIKSMSVSLFENVLFPFRKLFGHSMTPSPLAEGHVRSKLTGSRHSTRCGTRLSDATDQFIPSTQKAVYDALRASKGVPTLGGFGLYFDTKHSVMLHLDERPDPRLDWLRVNGEYIYEHKTPELYYKTLVCEVSKLPEK